MSIPNKTLSHASILIEFVIAVLSDGLHQVTAVCPNYRSANYPMHRTIPTGLEASRRS